MSEQAEAKKSSKRSFSVKNFYRLQLSFRRRKVFFLKIGAKFFFREREEKKVSSLFLFLLLLIAKIAAEK